MKSYLEVRKEAVEYLKYEEYEDKWDFEDDLDFYIWERYEKVGEMYIERSN